MPGHPNTTKSQEEQALEILLQLGKLVYERHLDGEDAGASTGLLRLIASSDMKKTAVSASNGRRLSAARKRRAVMYPNAGAGAPKEPAATSRKKKDFVALNAQKYSSPYKNRRMNVSIGNRAVEKKSRPAVQRTELSGNLCRDECPNARDAPPAPPRRRGDVVMHYPFCDDAGSVGALIGGSGISGESSAPVGFQNLPRPLQRKMIEKIFDEFRVSKNSMRISDINEGLKVAHEFRAS